MDRMFGHYRIVDLLGRGGMGEVYRAEDLKLRRTVALKLLPRDRADSTIARERLIREACSASRLTHPNIATIYEVDEVGGQVFVSMEYIEGEALTERVARGTLTLDEIVRIGTQIADGLAAAHEHGVIHRDVKPANVLIGNDGQVKIVDFGLALQVEPPDQQTTDSTAVTAADRLTRSGSAVGTVAYMSPEQASGETPDARTDLFSLGVVLYEMATRALPFRGNTPLGVAAAIMHDPPVPFSESAVDIPAGLREIILRCLAKDKRRRPASAKQVADALRKLGTGHTTGSISQALGRRPGTKRALVGLTLVVVLAGAGWVGYEISQRIGATPPAIEGVESGRAFDQALNYERRGGTLHNQRLAEQMYRKALELEGNNPYLKAHLARFLAEFELNYPGSEQGRLEEVRRLTDEALEADDELYAGWVARSRLLLIDGDEAGAAEAATAAIGYGRQPFRGHMLLGEALVRQGDVEAGLNELRKATDLGEGHIYARARLAYILFGLNRLDESAVEYRKILDYAPDSPAALNNLAVIYLSRGNYLDSIGLLEQLLELQPDDYAATNLGSAYFFLDRMDEAIAAYHTAVELAPEDAVTKQNLAEALEKDGRTDEARTWFERALTDYDRDLPNIVPSLKAATLAERAFCAAKLQRFSDAIENLREALELSPNNGNCLRSAARVHALAGDRDRAFEYIRQAIAEGYPREDLRRDPAFEPYGNDGEFLRILTAPSG